MKQFTCILLLCTLPFWALAQQPDEEQLGAWYMYFFSSQFNESNWGIQGDYQYRDWRGLGDREQLLLRTGLTYTPTDSGLKLTLGYGHISSGVYGTDSDALGIEHRLYQEAMFGQTILGRLLLTHRFRFEQRFVEDQDFRTRYRYNLFVNIPLNNKTLTKNTYYVALYNELFINGERQIGDDRSVAIFDRNRTYAGMGYALNDNIRFQLGWMKQTTDNVAKDQLQFSMHHTF